MTAPSRLRSTLYATIAGLGLGGMSYWFGTVRGAEQALDQFRDLSFQNTGASMERLLRFDAMLAAGEVDGARRGMGQVAWSHYQSLEDDAGGAYLPPSAKMLESIPGIRQVVSGYCASGLAAPAAPATAPPTAPVRGPGAAADAGPSPGPGPKAGPDVCRELAQRGP
jgi:hypothetical protein